MPVGPPAEDPAPPARAHFACFDATGTEASLVQVHADAASADAHMEIAADKIVQGLALSETVSNATAGVPVSVKPTRLGEFHQLPADDRRR